MSLIQEALQAHLEGYAGLAALVDNRVYPTVMRQGSARPAVVYQLVGGESLQRHRGPMGKAQPFFQITAWADTYAIAAATAEQVKLAMFAFVGTFSGVVVDDTHAHTFIDRYDPEVRLYGISRDYELTHTEAVV